ncbi:hypothetical protein HPB52_018798 [Rhipicephalus sanguineus]|uniref:Uncharacterized protein n=1 Tax=Rhipicephalus sanguineus TaxID=34632 RepID=A0A9D4YQP8_RHISA|nr:hypothetical protein HPB52_018798 [Rhipicephalus sanguineus]
MAPFKVHRTGLACQSLVFAEPTARAGLGACDFGCYTAVMTVEVSAVAYPSFACARVIQSPCWAPPTRSTSVVSVLCSVTLFAATNGGPLVRVGHRWPSATRYSLGTSSLGAATKVAAPNGSPNVVAVQCATIGLVEPNCGPPVRVGPRRLPAARYFLGACGSSDSPPEPESKPSPVKEGVLIDLCSEIDTTLQVAPIRKSVPAGGLTFPTVGESIATYYNASPPNVERSYYNVARLNDARPTYSNLDSSDRYYSCVTAESAAPLSRVSSCPSLSVDDLLSTPNNSGQSQGLPSQVDAFDWLDAKMEAVRKAQVSPKHVSLYSRLPPSSMGTTKSATVCGVPLLRPPPSRDKRLFPSDVQVTGVDLLQQLPPPPTLPAPLAQGGGSGS